jgi:hypothetical protein
MGSKYPQIDPPKTPPESPPESPQPTCESKPVPSGDCGECDHQSALISADIGTHDGLSVSVEVLGTSLLDLSVADCGVGLPCDDVWNVA